MAPDQRAERGEVITPQTNIESQALGTWTNMIFAVAPAGSCPAPARIDRARLPAGSRSPRPATAARAPSATGILWDWRGRSASWHPDSRSKRGRQSAKTGSTRVDQHHVSRAHAASSRLRQTVRSQNSPASARTGSKTVFRTAAVR